MTFATGACSQCPFIYETDIIREPSSWGMAKGTSTHTTSLTGSRRSSTWECSANTIDLLRADSKSSWLSASSKFAQNSDSSSLGSCKLGSDKRSHGLAFDVCLLRPSAMIVTRSAYIISNLRLRLSLSRWSADHNQTTLDSSKIGRASDTTSVCTSPRPKSTR